MDAYNNSVDDLIVYSQKINVHKKIYIYRLYCFLSNY